MAGVDTQTDRITAEVRALLLESLPPPLPGAPPQREPVPWGWIVASAALAIALVSTTLWWRNVNQLNEVKTETGVKGKELFHPVRIILTGAHSGPEFDKLIPLLEDGSKLDLPAHVSSVRERVEAFIASSVGSSSIGS